MHISIYLSRSLSLTSSPPLSPSLGSPEHKPKPRAHICNVLSPTNFWP